jgi:hypothetical protein
VAVIQQIASEVKGNSGVIPIIAPLNEYDCAFGFRNLVLTWINPGPLGTSVAIC